ncbi:uncharacterized protein METZ01_LOCUS362249, partial [marine metagenome]
EMFPLGDIPGIKRTHDTLFVGHNIPPVP